MYLHMASLKWVWLLSNKERCGVDLVMVLPLQLQCRCVFFNVESVRRYVIMTVYGSGYGFSEVMELVG